MRCSCGALLDTYEERRRGRCAYCSNNDPWGAYMTPMGIVCPTCGMWIPARMPWNHECCGSWFGKAIGRFIQSASEVVRIVL